MKIREGPCAANGVMSIVDLDSFQRDVRAAKVELEKIDMMLDAIPHRDRVSDAIKRLNAFIACLAQMASAGGFRSENTR